MSKINNTNFRTPFFPGQTNSSTELDQEMMPQGKQN